MTSAALDQNALLPSAPERRELAKIGRLLESRPPAAPQLVVGDERVDVPAPLVRVMVQWLRSAERGEPVTLVSEDKPLTTQQAADLLGVSRQYFVQLLERGDLPFTKTGTHRRVRARDVPAYKRQWDSERRAALDRLVELSEELGLHESTARLPKKWIRLDPAEVRSVERAARSRTAPTSDEEVGESADGGSPAPSVAALDTFPEQMAEIIAEQAAALKKSPKRSEDVLSALGTVVPNFAGRVHRRIRQPRRRAAVQRPPHV
jgi:excisionase family DNA binding protein